AASPSSGAVRLSSPGDAPKGTYAVLPGRWAGYPPPVGPVAHVLRTRSPVSGLPHPPRLACVKHAASVRPEPGSNSPIVESLEWLFDTSSRRSAIKSESLKIVQV